MVVCELVGVDDRSSSATILVLVSVVPSASVTVIGARVDSSVNATSAAKRYAVTMTVEVLRRLLTSVHSKLTSGISFRVTAAVLMIAAATDVVNTVWSS